MFTLCDHATQKRQSHAQTTPHRGEKWFGEQSQISWAYYWNVVRDGEIVITMYVVIALNTHKLEKTMVPLPCQFALRARLCMAMLRMLWRQLLCSIVLVVSPVTSFTKDQGERL